MTTPDQLALVAVVALVASHVVRSLWRRDANARRLTPLQRSADRAGREWLR